MNSTEQNLARSTGGVALGVLTGYVVAVALGGAYRESEMLDVLLLLAVPPTALFFVYRGSEKRFVFCVSSLLLAGIFFDLSPLLGVSRAGLSLVLMTIAATVLPVIVDLVVVDMGRQIEVTPQLARMAQIAFVVAILPLAGLKLVTAHRDIVKEDGRLVGELAPHVWVEGDDTLVLDPIDRKKADKVLRRLAIRTKQKTYFLSDADVETVRETRTVRRSTTKSTGNEATEITREQEDRLRLILKLQGTGIPDEIVLYSHRGPMAIAEAKVW